MKELLIGEFLGTFVLVFLNNTTVSSVLLRKTKATDSSAAWLQITLGSGFAVMMGILAGAHTSFAHLNPAVSFGFYILGEISFIQFLMFALVQISAGIIASMLVYVYYRQHYIETSHEPDLILATFSTSPSIDKKRYAFSSEMIATSFLMLSILAIVNYGGPTYINAFLIGLAVFTLGNSVGANTGFAMNPARDLGPRIAHALLPIKGKGSSRFDYGWIPVLGPVVGASITAIIYLIAT